MTKTQLFLEETGNYFYTISDYKAENPLSVVKAILKEFIVYSSQTNTVICKLYKTVEGSWYDLPSTYTTNTVLIRTIQKAIDKLGDIKTHDTA